MDYESVKVHTLHPQFTPITSSERIITGSPLSAAAVQPSSSGVAASDIGPGPPVIHLWPNLLLLNVIIHPASLSLIP